MFRTPKSSEARSRPPSSSRPGRTRSRWAAIGAAVAVTCGAGGIGLVEATISDGERPVLVPIEPCRLMDSRAGSGIGPRQTPIGTGETYEVAAHGPNGNCTIPSDAVALSLNVTAVRASASTNVRIFPSDASLPLASNLNPSPRTPPVPNSVTTDLDPAGMFSIYNEFGQVDIVVDVNGFYEDHDHDDRYYTEAETDAAVAAAADDLVPQADVLWAVVDGNGSLARSSDGVTSSELLDGVVPAGDYAVVFDRDVSDCAYQATVGRPGTNIGPLPGFAQVANWTDDPDNGVIVFTKDQDGAGVENRGFHLLVTC